MTQYPNWFAHYADRFFSRHLADLAGRPDLRCLQIGAFTGDASLWLLEHTLTGPGSALVDVDTWEGSDEPEHEPFDWADVERTYDERTAEHVASGRLIKFKGTSLSFFRTVSAAPRYDFIYIDGDHTARTVLSDAVNAYRRLKPGGLIAFDDYLWKSSADPDPAKAPGVAIDAFMADRAYLLDVLEVGLQAWFRRR